VIKMVYELIAFQSGFVIGYLLVLGIFLLIEAIVLYIQNKRYEKYLEESNQLQKYADWWKEKKIRWKSGHDETRVW
jgi:uncharacterized membrane protein YbaN (DUF454 family)